MQPALGARRRGLRALGTELGAGGLVGRLGTLQRSLTDVLLIEQPALAVVLLGGGVERGARRGDEGRAGGGGLLGRARVDAQQDLAQILVT